MPVFDDDRPWPGPAANHECEVRPADSPLVERITQVRFKGDQGETTTPDGCWDLVFMRCRGRVSVLQTGLITRPVFLPYAPGDEYLCVSFKPGVFMPRLPGMEMLDRGLPRPVVSKRAFWLDGEALEIPTFENAEGLVTRLSRRGIITRDEIVQGVVENAPRAVSPRSVQRHFMRALGMTSKTLEQIQRARRAALLLEQGHSAAEVATQLGYADQPHLTRSVKRILDRTPGEIIRSRRP